MILSYGLILYGELIIGSGSFELWTYLVMVLSYGHTLYAELFDAVVGFVG